MLSADNNIRKVIMGIGIALMLNGITSVQAQYVDDYRFSDSLYIKTHSPNRATFMSAVLPGLGQIYNQKYWKVPLIYAGIGSLIYYTNFNNFVYNKYKDAYNIKLRIDKGETDLETNYPTASAENLRKAKDTWRRYRDMCIIGIGVFYVAQIIDANVDANLFDYDMSEDLSLRFDPVLMPNEFVSYKSHTTSALGFKCSLRF